MNTRGLNRALVALCCLAAAVSCAKVTEQVSNDPAAAAQAPAVHPPAEVDTGLSTRPVAKAPDPAPLRPDGSNAASAAPSADQRAAPAEPPLSAIADAATAVQSTGVVAAAPAGPEPERAEPVAAPVASIAAAAASDGEPLDVASLLTRLRKTKAINLRTKLSVKHESDDLLQRFRAYHAQDGTATLAELRRSYDSLFRKLHSLLDDEDPPLARDIDRSRAAIWAILADPRKFGASALTASREPRA